jgi:hypothetical protein
MAFLKVLTLHRLEQQKVAPYLCLPPCSPPVYTLRER